MAEGLRAGVPQLIVPSGFDQFDNGERARRLGVAEVLPAKRVNARRLQRRLQRLLEEPGRRQQCQAAAARLAQGLGRAGLLDRIEALVDHQHRQA